MKNSKLNTKVNELIAGGWCVIKWGSSQMNRRFYKTCTLTKDGNRITVNHQGGTQGLTSALSNS